MMENNMVLTSEQQLELESILSGSYENVPLKQRKRVARITWVKNGTLRKVTHLLNGVKADEYEDTLPYKLAAAYLLNSYWGIALFWWIKWRLMFWGEKYSIADCSAICEACKKKVQAPECLILMTSQLALRDTLKQMTRKEIEAYRLAPRLGAQGA